VVLNFYHRVKIQPIQLQKTLWVVDLQKGRRFQADHIKNMKPSMQHDLTYSLTCRLIISYVAIAYLRKRVKDIKMGELKCHVTICRW